MNNPRKVYVNEKWQAFANKIKHRDEFKCLQCKRNESEVILQVHHETYIEGKPPWEYALSDCITLCKGCHARAHRLIEPDRGWTLIFIEDLGSADGTCERPGCGNEIRYAHLVYHPAYGYKIIGSTCVDYLAQEDRLVSSDIIKTYQQISKYVHNTAWRQAYTKSGKRFIYGKYKHHTIRIYGKQNNYAFQLILKEKAVRWHDYKNIIGLPGKSMVEVKELAYIALRGTSSDNEAEKQMFRNIYRKIK